MMRSLGGLLIGERQKSPVSGWFVYCERPAISLVSLVTPGLGVPVVVVPLRAKVLQHGGALAVQIACYAAEVFETHPAVCGSVGRHRLSGIVEAGGDRCLVNFTPGTLESLGFGVRERADVFLRAEL